MKLSFEHFCLTLKFVTVGMMTVVNPLSSVPSFEIFSYFVDVCVYV